METTTNPDNSQAITFEQFMAALQASGKEFDRRMKEWDEKIRLRVEEENRRRAEEAKQRAEEARQRAEEARQDKERYEQLNKVIGKYGSRLGEMIEHMIRPNLLAKFKALGLEFTKLYTDIEAIGEDRILAEIDALLESKDMVMVVEIKSKPAISDIKEHIERMDKLRIYADNRDDKRKYMGAVGGMVFNENERNFALKCGFYVIVPSGDTFDIIAPEGIHQPREW